MDIFSQAILLRNVKKKVIPHRYIGIIRDSWLKIILDVTFVM